jgi:hypothetical protein
MRQIEPYVIQEQIFAELFFSKLFPTEELIAKNIMQRTGYGLTLTQHFKNVMLEKMQIQSVSGELIGKFERRKYLDINLEDLWLSIVLAVCDIYGYNCKISDGKAYVDEENASDVQTKASAVYTWFKHIQTALQKREKENIA